MLLVGMLVGAVGVVDTLIKSANLVMAFMIDAHVSLAFCGPCASRWLLDCIGGWRVLLDTRRC